MLLLYQTSQLSGVDSSDAKCPKMSIVVTPAVGSLLTGPPGDCFMHQLAVPSFIVPGKDLVSLGRGSGFITC